VSRFRSELRRRLFALGDWRGVSGVTAPEVHEKPAGLTPDGRLRTGSLAGLSMGAAIWALTWPILIESFLNSFVGLTDTVLAAQLGVDETDAVGSASYVIWFMGLVVMAIGVGTTALISRSVGRGRLAVANAAVGQSLLLAGGLGTVVGVLIAVAGPGLASLLTQTDAGAAAFSDYLRIVAAGTPFMAILGTCIAALRGAGDSVRPLWSMVVVNVVNIVSSWLLCGVDLTRLVHEPDGATRLEVVLANPSPVQLGVSGIAWGTVIANAAGCAIVMLMLVRGVGGVRLLRRRLRPHWHTMLRLVRVGLPNFFETFGMWVGNFLVLAFVIHLSEGPGMTGAHILAIRIESFSFLPGFAMSLAAATLAGQYLGAGSPRLARRAVWRCAFIGAALMGCLGLLFLLLPRQLASLLSSQEEHLRLVPDLLVIAGFVQIPFALSIIMRGALRGVGDTRAVFIITWATTYLVRLPLAYLFSGVEMPLPGGGTLPNPFPHEPTLTGLWIGLCVEILIRCALFVGRFMHGGWAAQRV